MTNDPNVAGVDFPFVLALSFFSGPVFRLTLIRLFFHLQSLDGLYRLYCHRCPDRDCETGLAKVALQGTIRTLQGSRSKRTRPRRSILKDPRFHSPRAMSSFVDHYPCLHPPENPSGAFYYEVFPHGATLPRCLSRPTYRLPLQQTNVSRRTFTLQTCYLVAMALFLFNNDNGRSNKE